MNQNQLETLFAQIWTVFKGLESQLLDHRRQTPLPAELSQAFARAHLLLEEVRTQRDGYGRIRRALLAHGAGQPYDPHTDEDESALTIWQVCLLDLAIEDTVFPLGELSPELQAQLQGAYRLGYGLCQGLAGFFNRLLGPSGWYPSSTPDGLPGDIAHLELSLGAEDFARQMQQARQLCQQEADPALLLTLFP